MTHSIHMLTTSWQQAWGAMFRHSLGNDVLIFAYTHPARRKFHTYFCPPLRVLAFDLHGRLIFDQAVRPSRFVSLPETHFVVEADPDQELDLKLLSSKAIECHAPHAGDAGTWQRDASLSQLFIAMLSSSVEDLKRAKDLSLGGKLTQQHLMRLDFQERSQIANSAAFVQSTLDARIPDAAIQLSENVLMVEKPYLGELFAFSAAGESWHLPGTCVRCGKACRWRPILCAPPSCPPESAWRYDRPENHLPICKKCITPLDWPNRIDLRIKMALILWQSRSVAFLRLHLVLSDNAVPAVWDRLQYPLWPRKFGGESWEDGSGAYLHVYPRPPLDANYQELLRVIRACCPQGRGQRPKTHQRSIPLSRALQDKPQLLAILQRVIQLSRV